MFDQLPDILSLIGHGSARWLHPHIYEWPNEGSEEKRAGLPIMDWTTGTAGTVVDDLRPQWERLAKAYGIKCHLGVCDFRVEGHPNGKYLLRWRGKQIIGGVGPAVMRDQLDEFDIVILSVGFGLEEKSDRFPATITYWAADNIERDEAGAGAPRRVLVSGTGDGGLIDVLRYSFRRFRHDTVLDQLQQEWLTPEDLARVKDTIPRIETQAWERRRDKKSYVADLNLAYRRLAQSIRLRVELPRREDIEVWHAGLAEHPLDLDAAPLNRFLYQLTATRYLGGGLDQASRGEAWTAVFAGKTPRPFDDVVVRHGPVSALKKHFGDIVKRCAAMEANAKVTPDPSRIRVYDAYFDRLMTRCWQRTVIERSALPLAAMDAAAMRLRDYRESLSANQTVPDWQQDPRPLSEVFVAPSIAPAAEVEAAVAEGPNDVERLAWRSEVAAHWLAGGPTRRVVVGPPGSGRAFSAPARRLGRRCRSVCGHDNGRRA